MKKRFISLILALAVLTGLLAGCGSKADAPATNAPAVEATGEKITVALAELESAVKALLDHIDQHIKDCEAEMDDDAESIITNQRYAYINKNLWDLYINNSATNPADLAAGGGTYDVIELDNSWVEKYVNNGWIAPLNDYITDEMKAGIIPGLLDKFSSGDQLYGIAWNNDTRFYMYNAAKLQEIGMDHAPATWDEALDAYGKLKEKGLVNAAYIDCYNQEWAGATELIFLTASFGGKLLDEDGHPVMGKDAKTKAAYEFLVQGLGSGFIDASSLTSSQETTNDVFCMGDTFLFLQAWPSVYANANNSEVSNIVGQIDVADTIIHAEGEEGIIMTLPEAMSITSTSQNKEAAWKYIEFMSSRETEKAKAIALGALPIWTDLLADKELLAAYPYWENFGSQIDKATGLPSVLWYDEFVEILTVESQRIMLGEISVEDGLASMQTQCEALEAEYSK